MKIRILILMALAAVPAQAGKVTTSPAKDSDGFIIIGKDQNVTFTAAGSGTVITSLSAPGATVTGGFGSYTATFTSEPINQLCTLTVDSHTVLNPQGPDPIICTQGKQFQYHVIVPIITGISVYPSDSDSHELGVENEKDIIATAKGSGNVQLVATIDPDLDAVKNKLAWSGATADGSNKIKATLSRSSGTKVDVEASFSGLSSGKRQAEVYVLSGTFITPAGSPVTAPNDSGDGQNEFTFNNASPGVLTMKLKAQLEGISGTIPSKITDELKFEVDDIQGSTLAWLGSSDGKPSASANALSATATFTNLPSVNSSFGAKIASLTFKGSSIATDADYEVFYTGVSTNHPGGSSDPNWFFYYKNAVGGGNFTYNNATDSSATPGGGDTKIKIANDAYAGGNDYIVTGLVNQKLRMLNVQSAPNYFPSFVGILAHERNHANSQTNGGSSDDDDDYDYLRAAYEASTSKTDSNDRYSARGSASTSSYYSDGEVYAGGPIEKSAIDNANKSLDWANPGSNSK